MTKQIILGALAALTLGAGTARAQALSQANQDVKKLTFDGRPLSSWIQDLKAEAPQTRNAAAYAIGSFGPAAKAAVPALIETLKDPIPAVRYPACIALREIGPAATDAVPALQKTLQDPNDDVAAMARKALKAITGKDPLPDDDNGNN